MNSFFQVVLRVREGVRTRSVPSPRGASPREDSCVVKPFSLFKPGLNFMPFSDVWWSLLCFSIGSRLDCKFFSGEGCVLYFYFAIGTKSLCIALYQQRFTKGFSRAFFIWSAYHKICGWLFWWPFGIDFAYNRLGCFFGRSLKCTVQVGKPSVHWTTFPQNNSPVDWRTHTRIETIFNISGLFSVHVNTRIIFD